MNRLLTPRELGYRFPAEWEPQRATWLAWPHRESDWPGKLEAVQWVYCEIISAITRYQRVGLVVSGAVRVAAETCLRRSGVDLGGIDWLIAHTDRSWTRDSFPTWLLGPEEGAPLGAVKFRFNAWARYPEHALDEAAGQRVARARAPRVWLPKVASGARLVLEGGAIDTDGEGTLLTTEQCLLGRQFVRNPGVSQAELEQLLGQYLCVDRVLWLPGGIAGDDTSGHVDDLARFVAPGKVVLAQEPNAVDENHRPLAAAREALEGSRDAKGRRIEVVTLPMPAARSFDGERLPASYANFLLANELVLVPTFNDKMDYRAPRAVSPTCSLSAMWWASTVVILFWVLVLCTAVAMKSLPLSRRWGRGLSLPRVGLARAGHKKNPGAPLVRDPRIVFSSLAVRGSAGAPPWERPLGEGRVSARWRRSGR